MRGIADAKSINQHRDASKVSKEAGVAGLQ